LFELRNTQQVTSVTVKSWSDFVIRTQ